MAGYGYWWAMLEMIASEMNETNKSSATLDELDWKAALHLKGKKFDSFLEYLQENRKITFKRVEVLSKVSSSKVTKQIEIDCPKLLELRDNYTFKKSKSTSSVSSNFPIEEEEEVEEEDIKKNIKKEKGPTTDLGKKIHEVYPTMKNIEQKILIWQRAYPNVSILNEVLKAKSWEESNSSKKKNKSRFINNWLMTASKNNPNRAAKSKAEIMEAKIQAEREKMESKNG